MREHGVRRLVVRETLLVGDSFELELELGPAGILIPVDMDEQTKVLRDNGDPDKCPCGHSVATEHNDLGCLLGCSNDLCASERTTPQMPQPN